MKLNIINLTEKFKNIKLNAGLMVLKKLINKPGDEVREMLEGMAMAFPEIIRLDPQWNNV